LAGIVIGPTIVSEGLVGTHVVVEAAAHPPWLIVGGRPVIPCRGSASVTCAGGAILSRPAITVVAVPIAPPGAFASAGLPVTPWGNLPVVTGPVVPGPVVTACLGILAMRGIVAVRITGIGVAAPRFTRGRLTPPVDTIVGSSPAAAATSAPAAAPLAIPARAPVIAPRAALVTAHTVTAHTVFRASNTTVFRASNTTVFRASNTTVFRASNTTVFRASNTVFRAFNTTVFREAISAAGRFPAEVLVGAGQSFAGRFRRGAPTASTLTPSARSRTFAASADTRRRPAFHVAIAATSR
jgi:hypothetical protein